MSIIWSTARPLPEPKMSTCQVSHRPYHLTRPPPESNNGMESDRIKLNAAFYDLTQEAAGSIFGAMRAAQQRAGEQPEPPPPLLQVQRGYAESPAWFL